MSLKRICGRSPKSRGTTIAIGTAGAYSNIARSNPDKMASNRTPSNRRYWYFGLAFLMVLGLFLGFWRHLDIFFPTRGALYFTRTSRTDSAPVISGDRANSQSTPPRRQGPDRARIRLSSQARGTETGRFGEIELVDVGDDTPDFAAFVAQQAGAAYENGQTCLLVTMVPKCPSCASLGYAVARNSLGNTLGRVRVLRMDLDEFEQEFRNLHLPIDRVPGFIRLDRHCKAVDFLDAGEWNTNDPAEFAPILGAFLQGRLKQRRHPWVRDPESFAVDL
jgi:hypothetical protein